MYAKLHRIAIRAAVCLAALGSVSVVNAGYAWPADPAGFSRSGPWGAGPGYAAGANDSTFGRVIHQQNGLKLQVAGRAVTMPVAYRFAQNAPRFAALAIYAHPGLRTAAGVASWLGLAGLIWDAGLGQWVMPNDPGAVPSSGVSYRGNHGNAVTPYLPNANSACQSWLGPLIGGKYLDNSVISWSFSKVESGTTCVYKGTEIWQNNTYTYESRWSLTTGDAKCPAGSYETPSGCSPTPPPKTVTQKEFEDILAPKPMPETVPQELPPNTPLPVEPTPKINPEPGENPQHRPMFVPTGDPVPNPNYDPNSAPSPQNQPFIQPGTRLNPSPTLNDPFRIDVQPVNRPKEDGNPMPGPESETNPNTGKDDKPKPEERPGLCDEYPDILACQKPELDTPDDEIPKTTKDVSYLPDNLFGGGSCPANKTMNIAGQQVTVWDWDSSCGYIQNYMRPVILVLCAFAAFVIVSGGTRQ